MIIILTVFGLIVLADLNRILIKKRIFRLWVFLAPYFFLLGLITIGLCEDIFYNKLFSEPLTTLPYQLVAIWCGIGGCLDILCYYKIINLQILAENYKSVKK